MISKYRMQLGLKINLSGIVGLWYLCVHLSFFLKVDCFSLPLSPHAKTQLPRPPEIYVLKCSYFKIYLLPLSQHQLFLGSKYATQPWSTIHSYTNQVQGTRAGYTAHRDLPIPWWSLPHYSCILSSLHLCPFPFSHITTALTYLSFSSQSYHYLSQPTFHPTLFLSTVFTHGFEERSLCSQHTQEKKTEKDL